MLRTVAFELRRLDTGGVVHRYESEGDALAFVRDVVRVAGHEQAAVFALYEQDSEDREHPIAQGADLVCTSGPCKPMTSLVPQQVPARSTTGLQSIGRGT